MSIPQHFKQATLPLADRYKRIRNSSVVRKSGTLLHKGLTAALILHGLTFTAYLGNEAYQQVKPSAIRAEFEKQYGFPIKGWPNDIENNKRDITFIAQVVAKEQLEKPFSLNSFRIEPDNYFKNNPIDQFGRLITTGHTGYYIPKVKVIATNRSASRGTWHHEIKHAKTFDILEHHPEFRTRWEALTTDENGNSLYNGLGQEACIRIRGLSWFKDHSKHDGNLSERLGFVSDYARTNFYEDVAEIGETIEMENHNRAINWLEGPRRNVRIAGKIALAEEYGLIAKGYQEFLQLEQVHRSVWLYRNSVNVQNIPAYMSASQKYLSKFPNSIYEGDIKCARATIMFMRAYSRDSTYTFDDAKIEYLHVLHAPMKSSYSYPAAIEKLTIISKLQNDPARAEIFERADKLFLKRIEQGDVLLGTRGVNDYLKEKKIF